MSNYYDLVQWQVSDPSNNLVKPWLTHPFLEVLDAWDLKDKVVLEYGGGRSTAWWRKKCNYVVTIESNAKFEVDIWGECIANGLANGLLVLREVNEGDQIRKDEYVKAGTGLDSTYDSRLLFYDIVVVDGILRYECMQEAISLLSDHGGKLIVDNWDQDGFLCPACVELMAPYEGHIYPQPGHKDHHGNCWKTAYFEIPAKL